MRNSNMFTLRGRTTADIEVKQPGDFSVCNFTLAVDRPYRKDKERQADFIRLVAYRGTANFLGKYVAKGTMIAVAGEIRTRSWEEDGNKRYATDFVVEEVEFAETKGGVKYDDEDTSAEKTTSAPAASDDDSSDELPF
jgi:single-strand DNA-binding protein